MREILFRGKRYDNNEWVNGGLAIQGDESTYSSIVEKDSWVNYPVLNETVGQYTGLTDKSGKKIFEGDIVKTDFGEAGKIVWRDFMWQIDYVKSMTLINRQSLLTAPKCEVIGNIHDNLELLEAGT